MTKIIVLDENTACRIAAGEVVERPLSVVKELVENSLDASADKITVAISDGGLNSITVVDNGFGISQEDLPLAFQRHATSKIITAEDLFRVESLGFRGEALPSIAAVSNLKIKTRTNESNEGYYLNYRGGKLLEDGPVGCPVGTVVTVKDLFFNTPARLKHLKSKATEAGLINEIIYKMALINYKVGFLLTHNGRQIFSSNGSGNLIDTIAAVYGVDAAALMIPLSYQDDNISIEGYISKPEFNRSTRQQITTSVNGRIIRDLAINAAIEEGYRGLLTTGRYPVAVVLMSIPPYQLDINVHPSKMEIKIESEDRINTILSSSIRKALGRVNLIPGFDWIEQAKDKNKLTPSREPFQLNFKSNNEKPEALKPPFEKQTSSEKLIISKQLSPADNLAAALKPDNQVDKQNEVINNEVSNVVSEQIARYDNIVNGFPEFEITGQIMNMYIVGNNDTTFYIIDQHAAHERILFEVFLKRLLDGNSEVQFLLVPVNINLKHYEKELLLEHKAFFNALGFVFEEFGGESLLLRGIPAECSAEESKHNIEDMIEILINSGKLGTGELNYKLASVTACKAAVKAGDKLSLNAMQELVKLLSRAKEPYTCPHGRPTLISFSCQQLDSMFKRT